MCANLNLSISVCVPSVHWGWMRSVWSWGLDEGLGPPSGASAEGYRSSPTSVFQVTGQDVTNSPNTHTYSAAVCVWCSSEKDTLVEANKKNQQSNPAVQPAALISKVPQPELQTHILSSDFCQSPLSSQQAWMSYFTDSGHGVSSVLRNNCPVKWAAGCEAELGGWLETKMMLGESSMRAAC